MLSIIIPTYNRLSILKVTLHSLIEATSGIDCEIIVVNDSKKHSIVLDKEIRDVRVTENPNAGAASARNHGFSESSGEVVLFMDDDMIINKEVVRKLLKSISNEDKAIYLPNWTYPNDIVEALSNSKFGRFLHRINYTSLAGWVNNGEKWTTKKVENQGIASYCLMVKRQSFEEIGGYNENFSFAGFEDYDLSEKLKKAGFRFFIMTDWLIYHNELDRLGLKNWLARRRRDAKTRKEAVALGYDNLKINNRLSHFPFPRLLRIVATFVEILATLVPNIRLFDNVYFRLINLLVAIHIYLGYYHD